MAGVQKRARIPVAAAWAGSDAAPATAARK